MSLSDKVVKYIKDLISIKSFSGAEGELASFLKDLIAGEGLDQVFIDKYGNVIGVLKGNIDKNIVFEGHMDHVPAGDLKNWSTDPYSPKIVDGKLYGRASADMKGAIAAMISSISAVDKEDIPNIYYVFVSQEENAEGVTFKYALEETLSIQPDLVVLGEATNLNISLGQRGRAVIHAVFHGRTSHASMPEEGVNSLLAASYFIEDLNKLNKSLPTHDILGKSTVVPTIINCFPQSSPVIPDLCKLNIDRRFIVGESEEQLIKEIKEVADDVMKNKLANKVDTYIVEEEIKLWIGRTVKAKHFFPAWITDKTTDVQNLLKLIRTINPEAKYTVWRFSTDGVYSAGTAGFTTIGYGPGDESLAHKPNEYVPVNHLVKAAEGYALIPKIFI